MARDAEPPRLKPEMASRRLLVLAFVRDYIGRWGESPSYGEIAAGCGITTDHARKLVKRLAAKGLLLRTPGPRGLALPEEESEAVRRLRTLGWDVDDGARAAVPRTPDCPLQPPIRLHYVPSEQGDGDGAGEADKDTAGATPGLGKAAP